MAKIIAVPNHQVLDNFYSELLVWPSRYRDFWARQFPELAAVAQGSSTVTGMWSLRDLEHVKIREMVCSVRRCLELKHGIRNGWDQARVVTVKMP